METKSVFLLSYEGPDSKSGPQGFPSREEAEKRKSKYEMLLWAPFAKKWNRLCYDVDGFLVEFGKESATVALTECWYAMDEDDTKVFLPTIGRKAVLRNQFKISLQQAKGIVGLDVTFVDALDEMNNRIEVDFDAMHVCECCFEWDSVLVNCILSEDEGEKAFKHLSTISKRKHKGEAKEFVIREMILAGPADDVAEGFKSIVS